MLKKLIVLLFCPLGLISCHVNEQKFTPEKPSLDQGDRIRNIRAYADIMRDSLGEFDDPSLTEVTKDFGYTVITAKKFPLQVALVSAAVTPWSSWWYPKKDSFLFDDSRGENSSPLSKYDLAHQQLDSSAGSAADFERKSYNAQAMSWEGLCDAWALAAISKPEPKKSVEYSTGWWGRPNIQFEIFDLKALLLKTYEAVDDSGLKYYGQKFTGDYTGWIYPDLFPEQFHRFVEVQLFQNKKAFIMDHDPGIQVWNVPVYKANYTLDSVPNEPNSIFVRMWLYSAESVRTDEKSFIGTREAVREYDYVLQGKRNSAGDLLVTSGYWVKGPDGTDSRKDHPDYVIQIPDPAKLVRKSWNPEINIELVDQILSSSY